MRRFVVVAAACALVTSSLLFHTPPPVAHAADNAGCPSPTEPSQIGTVYQVEDLADLMWVKGGSDGSTTTQWSSSFAQTADIDMTGCTWETGIGDGNASDYFLGSYDGVGFEIRNLTVSKSGSDYLGLFSAIGATGTVENVTVTNATVSGANYIGILAGSTISGATIANISTSGSVTGSGQRVGGLIGQSGADVSESSSSATVNGSGFYVGGLIGYAAGISNSSATGGVTGTVYVGGLAGYATGTVTNSQSSGDVQGTTVAIGGLLGQTEDSVTDSSATGDVDATGDGSGVGGLIGNVNASGNKVLRSLSSGAVSVAGSSSFYVGGLIGQLAAGTLESSYSTSSISAAGASEVGGLVGTASSGTSVRTSYATGNVTGDSEVAGLIGRALTMTIQDTFATGLVDALNPTYEGGLIGRVTDPTISNSYWDTQTTNQNNSAGEGADQITGESTVNMQDLSTFSGATWDISDGWVSSKTWGICNGTTYPFLAWQYDESPCSITSPTVDTAVSTSTGFTFNVTNYDSDLTYSFSATSGSASAGTASGSDLPVTVSGVSAGSSSTVTVTAARTGYASSTATVSGSALGGGGGSGGGGSVPTPEPSDAPTTPTAAPAAIPSPDELLLNEDGSPLTMSAGSGAGYLNSSQLPDPLVTTENALWTVAGEGFALQVAGPRPVSQQPRTTTSNPVPEMMVGQNIAVAVRGFAEGTDVRGWVVTTNSLASAPPTVTWKADGTGSALGTVSMDPDQPGAQTLQFRGQTASGSTLTILFGLEVRAAPKNVRFAVTFKKDSETLTKRSKRQLKSTIRKHNRETMTSEVTIRRLSADGREGRKLARERRASLRTQMIDLGVPKSTINISIKAVKKPRFASRAIIDVSVD